ncbi:SseB family protein [Micromonospora sp. CPCC 206060]|uniref:SseB family protein n=1 Tax=Micromonospora sp. CPCC 206060 TaxID=3122406 RepID=UPI002FF36321
MTTQLEAQGAQPPWQPVNEVERRLRHAVDQDDPEAVLRILAVAPLFLPDRGDDRFGSDDQPGPDGQRLMTADRDGIRFLLAFTSAEALYRVLPAGGWRSTDLPELVRGWADGDIPADWGLAVNPATPVGLLVAPERVPGLLPTPASLAGFTPANEVERLLGAALTAPDAEVLLDVLVTATVIMPTRVLEVDGVPEVTVFTSAERCADYLQDLAAEGPAPPLTTCDLVAVLHRWPGPGYRLTVNPGSPIGFSLGGERVPDLLRHAVALTARRLGPGGPVPAASAGTPASAGKAAAGVPAPRPEPEVAGAAGAAPQEAQTPVDGWLADLLRGRQ